MAERQKFTIADPVTLECRITALTFDWTALRVGVTWVDSLGGVHAYAWAGATAETMMTELRSADLSSSSMDERIFGLLQTAGVIPAGAVSVDTPAE
jgi:hypothetical protein